ncbi:MAG: aminopeptidase [Coriobacteriales bacterium]|jgi:aminopeptidase|nr:aminopeptidase [Coriobacteriales bacterium]
MPELTHDQRLRRYAQMIIRAGCNLQPGQELYLSASTDSVALVRLLTEEAYAAGARHVTVAFGDEGVARLHYDHCALEVFQTIPEWSALRLNSMAREGAAVLTITSDDPLAMVGIDPAKPMAASLAAHRACKEFYDALDKGHNVWCIAAGAAPGWATRVFPELSPEEATQRLWQAIFTATRCDDAVADPLAAWAAHRAAFDERRAWLNAQSFGELHYSNSLGTDLRVGLNPTGIWNGGGDVTLDGREFFPNMPTEEIFTTPDFRRVEGLVYSALPLVHNGNLIEDFWLRFKGGRAVECGAAVGREMLEALLGVDEGAARLGEVALVPFDSPIRNAGILFYNTLFDENASCHLAIGKGFPDCVAGGQALDEAGLAAAGVNESAIHVDFMIGNEDLRISGLRPDGSEVAIFEQGNWAVAG